MICERCNVNEASVFITKIEEGKRSEHCLCALCAQKITLEKLKNIAQNDFIAKIFEALDEEKLTHEIALKHHLQDFDEVENDLDVQTEEITCICGTTLSEIKSTNKAGCEFCYDVFAHEIATIIKLYQGGTQHVGKKLGEACDYLAASEKIKKIEKDLEDAIESENFEYAAKCRDMIRSIMIDTASKNIFEVNNEDFDDKEQI